MSRQSDRQTTDTQRKIIRRWIIVAFLSVFTLWVALVAGVLWLGAYGSTAEFGDAMGTANALFSALAFGGVLGALVLQQYEYKLQLDEMRETTDIQTKNVQLAQGVEVAKILSSSKLIPSIDGLFDKGLMHNGSMYFCIGPAPSGSNRMSDPHLHQSPTPQAASGSRDHVRWAEGISRGEEWSDGKAFEIPVLIDRFEGQVRQLLRGLNPLTGTGAIDPNRLSGLLTADQMHCLGILSRCAYALQIRLEDEPGRIDSGPWLRYLGFQRSILQVLELCASERSIVHARDLYFVVPQRSESVDPPDQSPFLPVVLFAGE